MARVQRENQKEKKIGSRKQQTTKFHGGDTTSQILRAVRTSNTLQNGHCAIPRKDLCEESRSSEPCSKPKNTTKKIGGGGMCVNVKRGESERVVSGKHEAHKMRKDECTGCQMTAKADGCG